MSRSTAAIIIASALLLGGCEDPVPRDERMQNEPVRRPARTGDGLLDRPLDPVGEPHHPGSR